MLRRRRPLLALGATAVVAGTAAHYGAKSAQANAAPEQPDYPPQGYPPPQDYPPPQGYPGNGSSAPESAESAQIEELKRLAALRDQGILTAEEFSAKKAQILGI